MLGTVRTILKALQMPGVIASLPTVKSLWRDAKLDKLYHTYEEKGKSEQVDPMRKVVPHTVTSFMIQQPKVGLPT